MEKMTDKELSRKIKLLGPWWHPIQFSKNVSAPCFFLSAKYTPLLWDMINRNLPETLHGKSIVDLGCWSGYYSLEASKKGAKVKAIDIDKFKIKQVEFVSDYFKAGIRTENISVYDIDEKEKFDYSFLLGVLYHLKHPLLAIEKVSRITKNKIFIESEVIINEKEPVMKFINGSYNLDRSNWWIPSIDCIKDMLHSTGFRKVETVEMPAAILGIKSLRKCLQKAGLGKYTYGRVLIVASRK